MLSDFAEERPIDGKQADTTFMHYVRRYALLGIRRGVLHGVLRHMCCAVRKQNPAANVSLIKRAHIFPDANGRILPNKAKRRGISPRRDVAFVLAESEPSGRVFCDKRRI